MSENLESGLKSKTFGREVATVLLCFLCYMTYSGVTQVSDWITPFAFMFSIVFGAKQEVVKTIAERLQK